MKATTIISQSEDAVTKISKGSRKGKPLSVKTHQPGIKLDFPTVIVQMPCG